jgi:hypothetical protein
MKVRLRRARRETKVARFAVEFWSAQTSLCFRMRQHVRRAPNSARRSYFFAFCTLSSQR